MPFRFLPDVALADIAFEAESSTVDGLFEECGRAISDIMVDPESLNPTTERRFALESESLDRLLYDFMTELIVVKDIDSLLFRDFRVRVEGNSLTATARGEPIDRDRHRLRNDVKAVTMHLFGIKRESGGWKTTVVLDI